MAPPDALSAEVRAMLDAMTPPAKTAIGRIAANAELLAAVQTAREAGDYERVMDLLDQPLGSRPLDAGQSFPPRG